jgi:hypothetical protein
MKTRQRAAAVGATLFALSAAPFAQAVEMQEAAVEPAVVALPVRAVQA